MQRRARCTKPAQAGDDDRARDHGRGEFAFARQQRRAGLVALADDGRPAGGVAVVENADQLIFDEAALLLDDQHVLQPLGESAARRSASSGQVSADLVDAQSRAPCACASAMPRSAKRLPQIEIGLAGGDDAEPRAGRVEHDPVEPVGAREGGDRRHLRPVQPPLLLQRRIGPADAEAARRHLEIGRQHDLDARGIDVDRGRTLDRLGDRLEADPAAGVARQREAQKGRNRDIPATSPD